jgi:hypothetical protein
MPLTYTLAAGDLAYIDSFSGLVPCKVLSIAPYDAGIPRMVARVRVTAPRPGWKRGEIHGGVVGFSVVARPQVRRRRWSTRIIGETQGVVG